MKKKTAIEKRTEVDKIASKIIKVKETLQTLGKEIGVEIPKALPLVVTAVLKKVAEQENTTIEDLLSEIQIIKPTPSDPIVVVRGRILVWWL